jgi:hypothetical protein
MRRDFAIFSRFEFSFDFAEIFNFEVTPIYGLPSSGSGVALWTIAHDLIPR